MLEPQRMDRVLVVGTKDVMETTINTLHKMDIFHVEDYTEEGEYFHIGKPLKSATSLSEKLLKLRSMRSYLGTKSALPFKEKREKILTGPGAEPVVARSHGQPEDEREELTGDGPEGPGSPGRITQAL